MRFLKNKIAQVQAFRDKQKPKQESPKKNSERASTHSHSAKPKVKKIAKPNQSPSQTPETSRETKNIVKNYGKAICKFISSRIAWDYLDPLLYKEQVHFKDFIAFVNNSKKSIDGLHHFRSILLPDDNDDGKSVAYKRIFRAMGEVFIKYFSINWIFDSKIQYKEAHIKFRFKMLRRIRCPELFTYLKDSKDKRKEN